MRCGIVGALALVVGLGVLVSCPEQQAAADAVKKKIVLFNGKDMTNFYTWLNGEGKNKDSKKVFTVKDGMIRVSGEVFGGFITEQEYENYHLKVEFKWGEETFKPRERTGRSAASGWSRSSAR